ncbi:hypothetical protein ABKS89_13665 [Pseudomonas sp. LABIM340]|uniref:hypothetical protein n=1 Tax=Pseudomonas sp. LABIM340 TaxID=3156585 RepID=UPI0032AF97C1
MSKLLKFRDWLSAEEAAMYLAGLIGEQVSARDIAQLHSEEWLPAYREGYYRIVRLEPVQGPNEQQARSDLGLPIFRAAEDVGTCYWLQLPSRLAMLESEDGGREVFTIRDEAGGYYAYFDEDAGEYQPTFPNEHDPSDCEATIFNPTDVFELSQLANTPGASEKPRQRREIDCLASIRLFNLGGDEEAPARMPAKMAEPPQRASSKLLIAALVAMLIEQGPGRTTQELIAEKIEEKYKGVRGLGSKTSTNLFAEAKKALRAAMAALQP